MAVKNLTAAFVFALAAGVAGAEAMKPVVPIMWRRGTVEETAGDLKAIARQSGLDRFFVAGPGFNEVMYAPFATNLYAEMGREIGEIAQRVAADGIEVGWWCSPSIRYVSGFAPVEDAFGGKSADNKKCPLDPAFQADWAAKVKAVVAEARPRMINIEDDYTLAWGRGLNGGGCFCPRHLELFAKLYGRTLSAAEIAAAFKDRTDENLSIRRAFADTVRESLCVLARKVRAAVDEVDPTVRICVCEPGASSDKDGASVESVARAFAGPNTRPAVRPSGAIYGAQTTPADVPGAVAHTFHTLARLPPDIETFYEADPYPHNRFFTSAAQMGSLMSGAVFAGAQNLLLYCLQYLDDPFEDPGYANEFNRLKMRLEAVRGFNRSRRAALRGVRIVWTSDAMALTRGLGGGRDAQLADEAFILAKFGLPYTMRAEGPAVLAGNIVESLTDAELRTRSRSGRQTRGGTASGHPRGDPPCGRACAQGARCQRVLRLQRGNGGDSANFRDADAARGHGGVESFFRHRRQGGHPVAHSRPERARRTCRGARDIADRQPLVGAPQSAQAGVVAESLPPARSERGSRDGARRARHLDACERLGRRERDDGDGQQPFGRCARRHFVLPCRRLGRRDGLAAWRRRALGAAGIRYRALDAQVRLRSDAARVLHLREIW